MSDIVEATDLISKIFFDRWKADTPSIIGYVPEVIWESAQMDLYNGAAGPPGPPPAPPIPNKAFARFIIRHVNGQQRSLSEPGGRRFNHYGVVIVQTLTPMSSGQNSLVAQRLAQVALSAFQGRAIRDVWFRNVRYTEIGRDGLFYQINVMADFERTEIA